MSFYKCDVVSIDAVHDGYSWIWNNQFLLENQIEFPKKNVTSRTICNFLRDLAYLTEYSKGKVRVEEYADYMFEIQNKSNGQPLFAVHFQEC